MYNRTAINMKTMYNGMKINKTKSGVPQRNLRIWLQESECNTERK